MSADPSDIIPEAAALPELDALEPQHLAWVLAYIGDAHFDGAKAAEMAGSKATTQRSLISVGSAIKARDDVQAALKALLVHAGAPAGAVLRELTAIAFDAGEETRARLKALELLGKHHRLFVDRKEVAGADGEPLHLLSVDDLIRASLGPDHDLDVTDEQLDPHDADDGA